MGSSEILIKMSCDYSEPVNMSDFFLNETQAQLQKAMFGFSDEFEQKTNKRIRDVFAGKNVEYLDEFVSSALKETTSASGPASKIFQDSSVKHDPLVLQKNIGNMILFAFAGHDTTDAYLNMVII